MIKCPSYVESKVNRGYEGRCRATKGYEICRCEGTELQCDFYPQVRARASQMFKHEYIALQIDEIIKQIKSLDLNGYQVEEIKRENIISHLLILKEKLEKENIT